jgi:hypothetical protein
MWILQKKDQEKAVVSSALSQRRYGQERLEDESMRLIENTRSNCVNCFYEIDKNKNIC